MYTTILLRSILTFNVFYSFISVINSIDGVYFYYRSLFLFIHKYFFNTFTSNHAYDIARVNCERDILYTPNKYGSICQSRT